MARSPFSTPRVLNALSSPLAASSSLDAGEPFADPDADLVLRSVDAVDFKVHKLFMTKAFDFFDDMFTIGDAEGHETRDGLPVITLSESASTLESVLRLVYTVDNPELSDLSQLRDVCAALDKYSIRHFPTVVVDALCRAASSHPEIVYALGCRYNIPRVVELAARQTLRNPRQLATVPKADLFYVSDAQRHTLLLFQQECIARAAEVAANITWLHMSAIPGVAYHGRHPPNCSCWRKYTEVRGGHAVFEEVRNVLVAIPEWCLDYLESVSNALRHGAYASGRAAISPQMLEFALRSAAGCSFCQESAHGRLFSFALTLQAEIDKRVSMVPFPPN